jgi:hypothetical protein
MKNLVLMHYYLGLEVWKRSDEIFFSKAKYAVENEITPLYLLLFWCNLQKGDLVSAQ